MSPVNQPTAKQLYSELLSLTQLYLVRKDQLSTRCLMSRDAYSTLRPLVPKNKKIEIKTPPLLHPPSPQTASSEATQKSVTSPSPPPLASSQPTAIATAPPPKNETLSFLPEPSQPMEKCEPGKKPSASDKKIAEGKSFALEPITASKLEIDHFYQNFFSENFPYFTLKTEIPSDQLALKVSTGWSSKDQILSVAILSFSEQDESLTFLKNIARAINLCLAPACIVSGLQFEKEEKWKDLLATPDLRLVIACDYELYLQKNLMQHYKPSQVNNIHYLNETPLLLLSDLSLYLKRPELKAFLWNAICNTLK